MKKSRVKAGQLSIIAASIQLMFAGSSALANPTGPQVVNGIVSFQTPDARTLNVTNSPGAIINWQGFSIGASEITRFIQQSSSSSVLNRVVGPDISQIYGQLLSNGRVFLINPSGIVIGPGAVVDTAGFVASTLNMLDSDFLAGKLKFQGDAASGSIINQGWIRTGYGGRVILVAPQIENSGLIHTPGGEIILAAGKSLIVTSLDHEGVQFELQAPTDSVLNVGKLLADGGAVGLFAGSLRHSGEIRANALVRDEAGQIVLKAQGDIQIAAGSKTSADGRTGGSITIQSDGGLTRIAGTVSAKGSAGQGGEIKLLGDRVAIVENAVVDASGSSGGGTILAGGDFQGSNPDIRNSSSTIVGADAVLRADATHSGDGGRIVVWSDDKAQFYGSLSAQGGPEGGNGGFAEVSGKQNLLFAGTANLGAAKGSMGTLLLDPLDLFVFNGGGIIPTITDETTDFPSNAATVSPATLAGITGNVTLFASRYMRISDAITLTGAGQGLTATVGTYTPPLAGSTDPLKLSNSVPNRMDIGADITTNGGAVSLNAPTIQAFNHPIDGSPIITTNGGAINLITSGSSINAFQLALNAGGGAVTANGGTGFIQLGDVTGGSLDASAPSFVSTGNVTTSGAVNIGSSNSSVNTGQITTAGGSVSINAASSVSTSDISTSGGAVTLASTASSIFASDILGGGGSVNLSGINVFTGIIDTAGAVALNATRGSISATVDNAASLSAVANNNSGSASVNISSNTALNASNVSATSTACFSFFGCQTGSVSLFAAGNINVGTVTASALVSGNNSISESVSITSTGGAIRAMSAASQVTAADVTLTTGQGTGGGIGTAATALNVNVERNFVFRPNGEFNVLLNGPGPNRLQVEVGVAPASQNYAGTLTKSGGGITLNANATDTTVTVNNFAVTSGFNQRVFNFDPLISLRTPNGALVANSVTVPEGDTNPTVPLVYTTATLPVTLSASGNLTVNNYTRQSSANSLAKTTTFSSDGGDIALGTISGNKDSVTVNAFGSDISIANLSTAGNVSAFSSSGDITIGFIDTTSGTGSVTLSAPMSSFVPGAIKAQTDSGALEISAGGAINISGFTIGTSGFTNPLDVAGPSVTLTSQPNGATIGFVGAPVVANTQNLTINAASPSVFNVLDGAEFNVSTGAVALKNLTVVANPTGVGAGGLAQVRTEAGTANDKTYNFVSDGSNFTFAPGAIPATQFAAGTLNFTANDGNVTLGNLNLGTGSLVVTAPDGSINAGTLDGAGISLSAGATVNSATPVSVLTGSIGSVVRPDSLNILAGNSNFPTSRSGSIETSGPVSAGTISLTSFNGNIKIGANGTDDIGSGATRAGAVSLTANTNFFGGAGTIQVGDVFASGVSLTSINNTITTGALDATSNITLRSNSSSITTGALDALSITIDRATCCPAFPNVSTGAIGGTRPAQDVSIFGSAVTIGGAVTGDPAGAASIDIHAFSGALTLGGAITGGDGSSIALTHSAATPFQFSTLNAGNTGLVTISAPNGIRQQFSGGGITAQDVELLASSGDIHGLDSLGGAVNLDLIGVKNLTFNTGGDVMLNVGGSQLDSLRITTNAAGPDTGSIALANMAGGQSLAVSDFGNGDFNLALSSTTPLDFTFDANAAGIRTTGGGITTSGGDVTLFASGVFDGTTGGITTAGGNVTVGTSGTLTTGAVSTGGSNTFVNLFSSTGIVVNNSVNTGAGGGSIFLNAGNGSITGGGSISSVASVNASANNGDIGTSGTPLAITTPTATLSARGAVAGIGNVFASLTGTTNLSLTADNDFSVASTAALSTLTLRTEGTGTGTTLSLTAPGQSFSFARPATDLFGNPVVNTFQILSAAGATPVTNATYQALDGDLLITGPASLNATNLTLQASFAGDIKLQGNAPLVLNNTNQTINNVRDLLITGDVTLNASGSQSISVNRDLIAQAQSGSIMLSAANQNISSSTGKIAFRGGAGADESVTVAASNQQDISTFQFSGGNVELTAGSGDRSSVTVSYTGLGTQTIQAQGNIQIDGGTGASVDSTASITTATGSQLIRADGNINLNTIGGSGTNATARIVNSGGGNQQIGESQFFFVNFPYQTNNITVQGGSGSGSFAEITAAGPQQIYVSGGTLTVKGGNGTNSFARIQSTSANEQRIGFPTYFCCGNPMNALSVQGGIGTGAFGAINAAGFQRVTANSSISLNGGSGADTSASLLGAGQDIRFGNMSLIAGTGNNANALVQSTSTQNIDPGNLTLTGGGGAGATATAQILAAGTQTISFANAITLTGGAGVDSVARIATTGNQTINFSSLTMTAGGANGAFTEIEAGGTQSLSGGNMTLTAGGVGETTIANAGAIIEGNSQSINAGAITLKGGAGVLGSTSDALLRNLSGNQNVFASSITLQGGHQHSTTGILNLGSGTQTVSGTSGITLTSDPITVPAHADSFVLIQNSAATAQTITASSGGLRLNNTGSGTVEVTSAGTQSVTARFVEVLTGAGSTGNSSLTSTGEQRIRTTNESANGESLVVAALGAGTAKIESGASQLLEVGYPVIMQGANGEGALSVGHTNGVNAVGNSLIQAVDQSVFAGSILIQGPSGNGTTSKLSATNTQTVSTLLGGIEVLGGSGDNSLATLDPLIQTILTNGTVDVAGGSGFNADASIVSAGTQLLLNTTGSIFLTGGSGSGADAIISSIGAQEIGSAGNITLEGGIGPNADALISSLSTQFVGALGNITLLGGPTAGSDAIISNLGAQQGCFLLTFLCGQTQTIVAGGSILLIPGVGNALIEGGFASNSGAIAVVLSADATQQTLATADEFGRSFDWLAGAAEGSDFERRVPICR